MATRVGLMGGTFDPIHHGHLVAAEEVRCALELERVVFIPAGRPWQKDANVTPADHRLEMTVLATRDNPYFEVSRAELDREGPTYTIDTLRLMRDVHPPPAGLYFITGADAISQILTWKRPEEALELATFVAVTRPGHDVGDLRALGVQDRVVVIEIPALAISSTDIRRRVAEGRPIRYLVPDQVARYVEDHGLYRT